MNRPFIIDKKPCSCGSASRNENTVSKPAAINCIDRHRRSRPKGVTLVNSVGPRSFYKVTSGMHDAYSLILTAAEHLLIM